MIRRASLVLLLVALALLASGCRKVVSQTYLERTVESYMEGISGVQVDATCPSGKTMLTDADFFCTTRAFGRSGTVLVHQLDRYGHVELTTQSPVDHEEAEAKTRNYLEQIRGEAGRTAQIRCPRMVVPGPDRNFTCTTSIGDVAVRQVDGRHQFVFTLSGLEVER